MQSGNYNDDNKFDIRWKGSIVENSKFGAAICSSSHIFPFLQSKNFVSAEKKQKKKTKSKSK